MERTKNILVIVILLVIGGMVLDGAYRNGFFNSYINAAPMLTNNLGNRDTATIVIEVVGGAGTSNAAVIDLATNTNSVAPSMNTDLLFVEGGFANTPAAAPDTLRLSEMCQLLDTTPYATSKPAGCLAPRSGQANRDVDIALAPAQVCYMLRAVGHPSYPLNCDSLIAAASGR